MKKSSTLKIVLSSQAFKDLGRIYCFIANEKPSALKKAALKLKSSFEVLQKFPQAGYGLSHLSHFREFLVPFGKGNFVIRYRIHQEKLFIVHLWHSREDR